MMDGTWVFLDYVVKQQDLTRFGWVTTGMHRFWRDG